MRVCRRTGFSTRIFCVCDFVGLVFVLVDIAFVVAVVPVVIVDDDDVARFNFVRNSFVINVGSSNKGMYVPSSREKHHGNSISLQ